jgi:hypothetical protein
LSCSDQTFKCAGTGVTLLRQQQYGELHKFDNVLVRYMTYQGSRVLDVLQVVAFERDGNVYCGSIDSHGPARGTFSGAVLLKEALSPDCESSDVSLSVFIIDWVKMIVPTVPFGQEEGCTYSFVKLQSVGDALAPLAHFEVSCCVDTARNETLDAKGCCHSHATLHPPLTLLQLQHICCLRCAHLVFLFTYTML